MTLPTKMWLGWTKNRRSFRTWLIPTFCRSANRKLWFRPSLGVPGFPILGDDPFALCFLAVAAKNHKIICCDLPTNETVYLNSEWSFYEKLCHYSIRWICSVHQKTFSEWFCFHSFFAFTFLTPAVHLLQNCSPMTFLCRSSRELFEHAFIDLHEANVFNFSLKWNLFFSSGHLKQLQELLPVQDGKIRVR